ncbi:MAG TPA: peptide ABC transporter substrate-binding protein [Verrucomicrobiae bacterium]|jgi:peptide/nickel transport system substrate-binding protein|nr:peptide ABC transporter substrate-binding protein [Verrucomicrobiae bacterium]
MRLAAALLAILVAGTACTRVDGPTVGGRVNSWTIPHTLRYATAEDISGLNPHFYPQAVVNLLSELTMAYLIRWDEHNRSYPELAMEVPTKANRGVSADGLTITYHLRPNVKWSDGVPFTADDVIFSIAVVLNPANNEVGRGGWDLIASAKAPDKNTVVLHMKKPYSPFVETFFSTGGANPCLLPKHLLAQYPNINNVPYNAKPIGIGPFKYVRWDRASQVILVPNPLYWRGLPKLQKIIFKIIPDRNTTLSQLQAKELDMWWPIGGAFLPQVQALQAFTVFRQPGYTYNHYDFNIQRPRVSDPAVRQALRLATDRVDLRNTIGHGIGIIQDEVAPVTSPYYDPTIRNTPFDIASAKALLDKAGWKVGAGGIRAKNGVVLNLDVASTTGTPDVDSQIELVRQWWKQIGVGMSVRRYPAPLMFEPAADGGIAYGSNWDLIFFAWGADPMGDFTPEYGCKSFPPNGQNDLRWCNRKAQAAIDAFYAHFDPAQQIRDDAVVMEQLDKDVPTFVTTLREDIWAYNKDLKNFHPNNVSPFDNMMDVDI